MKTSFYITLLFLFFISNSFSQNSHKFDWVKQMNGTGAQLYDVKTDSDGNVIITGGYTGSIDANLTSGQYILTTSQPFTYFIAKYSTQANLIWAVNTATVSSVNSTDFSSVDVTSNNDIIYVDSDGNFNKYSSNGDLIWSKSLAQCRDMKVKVDNSNSIILSGELWTTQDFDFTPQTYQLNSNGSNDIFVAKYNSDGLIQWAFNLGNTLSNYIRDLEVDNNNNVFITGPTTVDDFNPGAGVAQTNDQFFIAKYDSNGSYLWVKSIDAEIFDIETDESGNILATGDFIGSVDFNPDAGIYNLTSSYFSTSDAYFLKLNSQGIFQSASSFSGSASNESGIFIESNLQLIYLLEDRGQDLRLRVLDETGVQLLEYTYVSYGLTGGMRGSGMFMSNGDLIIVGEFGYNAQYYIFTDDYNSVIVDGGDDSFIIKLTTGYSGKVFYDFNNNGILDQNEPGIPNQIIENISNGEVYITDSLGLYFLNNVSTDVNTFIVGNIPNYTITVPNSQSMSISNGDQSLPNFGYSSNNPCSDPYITIHAPFLRRCFSNQKIYISTCNQTTASGTLSASYTDVQLNPLMTVTASSLPYTSLGNSVYRFQTGNINPGQCVNFNISVTISCNAMLGQTLCMNATLHPIQSCALDNTPSDPPSGGGGSTGGGTLDGLPQPCTLPWDQSSLSVDGWCENDTIYFTITNTGELGGGDMECYSPLWVTVDGVVTFTDSILIQGGQTITYSFPGDGATWILNAAQHPLHPGNSNPNANVEACGDLSNWTPDLVNDFPQDDADPVVDIHCGVVTGSYDPNDKTGYPYGVTEQRYIQPDQHLQYVIRFQNTGTDTAFTVVIRDTLDLDLNIFTVTPGVSSHNYEFRMYGPRVLEWTFNNILLPDSTTNEPESNGFVTFQVQQVPNLAPGTEITNAADIYFDFNDPIRTNTTMHRIYEGFVNVATLEELSKEKSRILVYPNPSNGIITVVLKDKDNSNYDIYDQMGRIVKSGSLDGKKTSIQLDFQNGMYYLKVGDAVVKVQIR